MLSIIIPIYNGEKYIVNCLDKLLKQTYKDYEIIIVDDGSIDNSLMLAKSYEEKYRNIRVYSQENSGPGVARKMGFNKSVGEYIAFVDVDDYLDENAYEIVINKMKEEQVDIVQFSFSFVNGDKINKVNLGDKGFVGNENCFNFYISQKDLTNTVTTKVYKRELFTNITWPNLFYSEDYALNAQLYGNANKVINISNALYYYVQHQESAIKQPFSERRLDQLAASDLVIEYARSNYPGLVGKALFYGCTHASRLAIMAYLEQKNEYVDIIIKKFKEYYSELKESEKETGVKIELDKTTKLFGISPSVALNLKRIQNKIRR